MRSSDEANACRHFRPREVATLAGLERWKRKHRKVSKLLALDVLGSFIVGLVCGCTFTIIPVRRLLDRML